MTEQNEMRRDERPLFNLTLQLVAEKIPPAVLGLLWTVHRMYGEWDCPAHTHGETCCVDVLLENTAPPLGSRFVDSLGVIILSGFDITIEATGDDRNGPVRIFLSHPDQPPANDLTFEVPSPRALTEGMSKAHRYAVAFPAEKGARHA